MPLRSAYNLVVGNPNKGLVGCCSASSKAGAWRARWPNPACSRPPARPPATWSAASSRCRCSQSGCAGRRHHQSTYKEFGVRLSLTPTVLARNRISLKVAPEVSDLDFNTGIQLRRHRGAGAAGAPHRHHDRAGRRRELRDLRPGQQQPAEQRRQGALARPACRSSARSSAPRELSRDEKELIMLVTPAPGAADGQGAADAGAAGHASTTTTGRRRAPSCSPGDRATSTPALAADARR